MNAMRTATRAYFFFSFFFAFFSATVIFGLLFFFGFSCPLAMTLLLREHCRPEEYTTRSQSMNI